MRQTPRSLMRSLLLALAVGALMSGCAPFAGANAARDTAAPISTASAATPTPTANPTARLLAERAQRAIGALGSHVGATYDAQKATATITVTVTGDVPNTDAKVAAAYTRIKLISYWVFPALWSSRAPLHEATVLVVGPIQDEYANIVTNWYGVAVVEATTAQRIHWLSVSPDAAWDLYDQRMLRISFVLFD